MAFLSADCFAFTQDMMGTRHNQGLGIAVIGLNRYAVEVTRTPVDRVCHVRATALLS